MRVTRRRFLQYGAGAGAGVLLSRLPGGDALAQAPAGGMLDARSVPKFATQLVVPPAMPRARVVRRGGRTVDLYEIAVRQFRQPILPRALGLRPTTVWGYGSVDHPETFHSPSPTIEARWRRPVRVKWINELVDERGRFLPHLLPVDQTLHWANPPGGAAGRDTHGDDQGPYRGPVPIVTHLHGGHSAEDSDGYPEAWYLPAASDIPPGYATEGSRYATLRTQAERRLGQRWTPGSAVFEYDNDQRAAPMWFHDHTLGMTRANVYAGPVGFYLLRGGPADVRGARLPASEIAIAIQDRMFTADGELFYPGSRAFFEGLDRAQLQIPFMPAAACGGPSDVAPIWNPEFFGDVMVVNGRAWPALEVQQRRYRLRILNGCNSRFLVLRLSDGTPFWQIGNEGGLLPAPVELPELLLGPAERADVIVDFTAVPRGTEIVLQNVGPDGPFSGGRPAIDFQPADPETTGQVMALRVVPSRDADTSRPPSELELPPIAPLGDASRARRVSLNESPSATVLVRRDAAGNVVADCAGGEPFRPVEADLGTVRPDGSGEPLGWDEPITEHPALGSVERWDIHNLTADAHPIHIHEVTFEVVGRRPLGRGAARGPEPWEGGRKDTVVAYPGEITSVKARFDRPGLFVWHCHILEHEDNEMMRPYRIGRAGPDS